MSTYFTLWHYGVLILTSLLFILLVILSFSSTQKKNRTAMIVSSFLVMTLVSVFLILAVEKYTKKAEMFGLKNRRMLNSEKIVYTGYVKNVGDYTIGKVRVEFKLVNKGHVSGNVKAGSFFKPSGLLEFFGGGDRETYRPQKIVETVVVARNLEPGKTKAFTVSLKYPPYFKYVSDYQRVFAH